MSRCCLPICNICFPSYLCRRRSSPSLGVNARISAATSADRSSADAALSAGAASRRAHLRRRRHHHQRPRGATSADATSCHSAGERCHSGGVQSAARRTSAAAGKSSGICAFLWRVLNCFRFLYIFVWALYVFYSTLFWDHRSMGACRCQAPPPATAPVRPALVEENNSIRRSEIRRDMCV